MIVPSDFFASLTCISLSFKYLRTWSFPPVIEKKRVSLVIDCIFHRCMHIMKCTSSRCLVVSTSWIVFAEL